MRRAPFVLRFRGLRLRGLRLRGLVFRALALLALAAGCDDEPASEDDPPAVDGSVADAAVTDGDVVECDGGACSARRCRELTYYEGPADEGLVLGEVKGGAFVPWVDGGDATYVFGFQGGVMVQPVVEVPAAALGDEPCARVTLRHRPDPDFPEDAGEVEFFDSSVVIDALVAEGDAFRGGPYADQIGWGAADGVRMIIEAEVRGVDYALRTEVRVRVVDEDGWDECDVVPTIFATGCELVELQGTITVEAVGDLTGLACDQTAPVTLTLTPSAVVVPDGCVELTRTLDVQRGCVESQSLTMGASFENTWVLPAMGAAEGCYTSLGIAEGGCACM